MDGRTELVGILTVGA